MSLKETKEGTFITIFVKPKSPRFAIESYGGEIVVHATEEPVKGKVNKEILREFTKLMSTKVLLVAGAASRQKTLFVKGIGEGQAVQLLHLIKS